MPNIDKVEVEGELNVLSYQRSKRIACSSCMSLDV
jgi:hypothetical protein